MRTTLPYKKKSCFPFRSRIATKALFVLLTSNTVLVDNKLRILHLKISDMLISFPTELFDQPFLFLMTLCVHSYWLNIPQCLQCVPVLLIVSNMQLQPLLQKSKNF